MFSRSDKSEAVEDLAAVVDDEPKQRSPFLLAALAGLLAIAGAFLLIRYFDSGSGEAAVTPDAAVEATKQVLVVTQPIPAGTEVSEIVAAPATYLTARAMPERFVAASAITSVEELRELDGLTLSSEALAGEQLLRGRFIDRSDFDNEAFIERAAAVDTPEGHHTVVLSLPAVKALGGKIRAGDEVAVVGTFRVTPADDTDLEPFSLAVMVLPVIEVVSVESSAEILGSISGDADSVGVASVGDFNVTVAVEPWELTELVYTMEFGEDLALAVALPDAEPDDERPFSTITTLITGSQLDADFLTARAGLSPEILEILESASVGTDDEDEAEAEDEAEIPADEADVDNADADSGAADETEPAIADAPAEEGAEEEGN